MIAASAQFAPTYGVIGVAIVGLRLREIRKLRDMTQADLAEAMNKLVPRSERVYVQAMVAQWELETRDPGSRELYLLSDALGVGCDVLRQEVGTFCRLRKLKQPDDE